MHGSLFWLIQILHMAHTIAVEWHEMLHHGQECMTNMCEVQMWESLSRWSLPLAAQWQTLAACRQSQTSAAVYMRPQRLPGRSQWPSALQTAPVSALAASSPVTCRSGMKRKLPEQDSAFLCFHVAQPACCIEAPCADRVARRRHLSFWQA